MTAHIEYHINVFHNGTWGAQYESHPVGTTFDSVIAKGWAWADQVLPMYLRWAGWAFPGGYEIHYITGDTSVLCHKCANDNLDLTLEDDTQWQIVEQDINYEDSFMFCGNCNTQIKPAYGDDEDSDDQEQATPGPA